MTTEISTMAFDGGVEQEAGPPPERSPVDGRRQHRNRMALVVITSIMTVFWSGAFFGWGPMQLMLEEDGAFEGECLTTDELPCSAQTSKLLNVSLLAQLTLMVSPIFGIWVDAYGPFCMMALSSVFMVMGLGGLALAVAQDIDALLYPAFILIGLTTISSHQNIMQAGILFQGRTQQRVISCMNALFDAGALTYLGLWAIKSSLNDLSLELLFGAYLIFGICVFGAALYFWSVVVPVSEDEPAAKVDDPAGSSLGPTTPFPVSDQSDTHAQTGALIKNSNITIKDPPSEENETEEIQQENSKTENPDEKLDMELTGVKDPTASNDEDYVLISERPILQQLLSKQYILLLIFFAFHSSHNIFTLITARDFLAYLGDDATGNQYLSIFVLLTPVSILGLPVMDYILNRYGYHAGLQSINVLAISYGIVKVASDSLRVQVFGFLLFSMFRCFMFTICFSFLPTFLGGKVVGRGAGVMVLSQGITSLINIPLASWAVNGLDGNFFLPNLLLTIAVIPFFFVASLLGTGVHKETRASMVLVEQRQRQRDEDSRRSNVGP